VFTYLSKEKRYQSLSLSTFYFSSIMASASLIFANSFIMEEGPIYYGVVGFGLQIANINILLVGIA